MVTASALVEKFFLARRENWGYIWGKYGQTWTAADQARATEEKARLYGSRWIGHRVADCSGLGYWAFRELGGYIYHGSNTIWNEYVTDRCELKNGRRTDGKPLFPGDPVFRKRTEKGAVKRHHIGYYVGGDTVIEAWGTQTGVVESKLTRWHETARWYNVDYGNGVIFMKLLTLKRGSQGEAVKKLQTLLNEQISAGLGSDGIFGKATEAAVRAFQKENALSCDGIVGPETWKALGIKEDQSAATGNGDSPNTFSRLPDPILLTRSKVQEIQDAVSGLLNMIQKVLED